jgi:p-cumate 2,3-dioxygenase beta subunit
VSAVRTAARAVTRAEVEDFLFHEAALLDEWRLDEWLALCAPDAGYYVPPTDAPEGDHRDTLFIIADDRTRLAARVKRLTDANGHAEYPPSRTRRLVSNVRIAGISGDMVRVAANFAVWRYRRGERIGNYVGRYDYRLRIAGESFQIVERRAILDAEELGGLGAVSFIL